MEILRILNEEPTHGYQLHKDLDITTSTIYRHLNELEEENVVTSEDSPNEDRILYGLTEKGENLLCILQDY